MAKAFTILELIFSIVIIGVLASVAIPKLNNVSIGAKQASIISFVASLNNSVGGTMWMEALKLSGSNNGSIATAELCAHLIPEYYDQYPEAVTGFSSSCEVSVEEEIADSGLITFHDGTATQVPYWTIDKTKFK